MDGVYFVSFATVYWIDVFVREIYFEAVVSSLDYNRKNKGMELFCYCIMPSHLHLIFRDKNSNPSLLLGKIKEHTSKQIQKMIKENYSESRREWMTEKFVIAGSESSNVKNGQFWQHHNKPIEIWTREVMEQKMNYIHLNPVVSGFVTEPHYWKYSSAMDYSGGKGPIEIDLV
jgi:REP element-mobilizing transposase RayT